MKLQDIIQQAKKQGLCEEWYNEMKCYPTLETLCRMFFKGDDWALKTIFQARKCSIISEEKQSNTDYS